MKFVHASRLTLLSALCFSASAMAAPGEGHVFSGIIHQTPYFGSSVQYATPNGQSDAMTDYTRASMLMPVACTARDLRVRLDSVDVGYTVSTVTLMVNGANSLVSCMVNGSGNSCVDGVNTAAIAAGATVVLKVSPALPARAITNVDSEIEVRLPFTWRCVE